MKVTLNSVKNYQIIVMAFVLVLFAFSNATAQNEVSKGDVYVDQNGVMRWDNTKAAVQGFGVNYSVPFAHAHRTANRLGVDIKAAIDNDVYHFTRLGFDLYRLHVWDTQISDEKGNLIDNEYLDAFDYLLFKLKKHNINYVVTPIAFWGNGWPEPDTESPGFSHKYGKANSLTNPEAIKAQETYLYQFLNHINPYTKVAYKSDPSLIAFEVSNEPHHKGTAKEVKSFVKKMITSMKKTGTKKPIFYNMSHAVHFIDAYFEGGADGGTFQWYPTGLGYQRELSGNLLTNVEDYNMPFENLFKKHNGAKLVYEFDAADVGKSYIYPAMARSFREAGIQIATHFAYDPTYMADVNTEYNTHYMNLLYTPQKALSLKISGEVFREIPMYSDFGKYPESTSFGDFKVNYENDLAEYNTEKKFFYTNTTNSKPKDETKLEEIAGFGNSELVMYDGLGAYFLDKIDAHNWRLEVLPDAVWVDNPFGRNSPNKTVGVIKSRAHKMRINLKDLGSNFTIVGINNGNEKSMTTSTSSFEISPGTYMVYEQGSKSNWKPTDVFKTNKLNNFFAPKSKLDKPWLKHKAPNEVTENLALTLKVQYIAPQSPKEIRILGYVGSERINLKMEQKKAYNYEVEIPKNKLKNGYLNYNIVVEYKNEGFITYPSNKSGKPNDWDFYDRTMYKVAVVKPSNPIELFDADTDTELLVGSWRRGNKLVPTVYNEAEYQIRLEKLFVEDVENLNACLLYTSPSPRDS